jgi:hypothetical protein
MAGGRIRAREVREERRESKTHSFESGWIFWFLCFASRLSRFLWNGRHRSCVPDAFLCFLSSGTDSYENPAFQTGPKKAVRFRETCLVVVARVRDEVLYTFFATPSTPLSCFETLVLTNVRQGPRPLRCPLAGTLLLTAAWPLVGI